MVNLSMTRLRGVRFKFLFSPIPNLLRQLVVHSIRTRVTPNPNGSVILPARDILRDRRPQLILRAILHRRQEPIQEIHNEYHNARHTRPTLCQVGLNRARVDRHHRELRVQLRHLPRPEDVCELAPEVPRRGPEFLGGGFEGPKVEATLAPEGVARRRQRNDPHILLCLGGRFEDGEKELCEERVAHVVRPELEFVPLLGEAGCGRHDSRVEHEYVKAIRPPLERGGGLLHRFERREVELEDLYGGSWNLLLDLFYSLVGLFRVSGREPYLAGLVAGEIEDGLPAQSAVGSRHKDHLSCKGRDVVMRLKGN